MDDDFRKCGFCGCTTNTKSRACCDAGNKADLARHILKGEHKRREADYEELHETIREEIKHLKADYLKEVITFIRLMRRKQQMIPPDGPDCFGIDEQSNFHYAAPKPHSAPDGQPETFSGLCERDKTTPIPLETDIDTIHFAGLLKLADKLGVPHNEDRWLDDDFPDKEDELRVKLIDKLERQNDECNR